MEFIACYKVTYFSKSPWDIHKKSKYYKVEKDARDFLEYATKLARRDNMFHNMPTIDEILLLNVNGKSYSLGTPVTIE